VDVFVAVNIFVHDSSVEFLANVSNKCQFTCTLHSCLPDNGFQVWQARDDTNTLLVQVALDLSSNKATEVVAYETKILVLLIHH
jgi:hypothetical protein